MQTKHNTIQEFAAAALTGAAAAAAAQCGPCIACKQNGTPVLTQ
jgi:hypothetical protein